MQPILTIAVPTFNRAEFLEALLANITKQLSAIAPGMVEVLISDNCSTDRTTELTSSFVKSNPSIKVIRNTENKGADYNIAQCYASASGAHVWIMGDDDLIAPDSLPKLVQLLVDHEPDLVYLASQGLKTPFDESQLLPHTAELDWKSVGRESFARHVNVYLTFISGLIVRKSAQNTDYARIFGSLGTSLIQLDWAVTTLLNGSRFIIVRTVVVCARVNQSGGYKLFEVFGKNYTELVERFASNSPRLKNILVGYSRIGYLPNLIYMHRFASVGNFSNQNPLDSLGDATRRSKEYKLILAPIALLPKPLAFIVFTATKISYRIIRKFDQIFRMS